MKESKVKPRVRAKAKAKAKVKAKPKTKAKPKRHQRPRRGGEMNWNPPTGKKSSEVKGRAARTATARPTKCESCVKTRQRRASEGVETLENSEEICEAKHTDTLARVPSKVKILEDARTQRARCKT